jgi:hypothetical protein
MWFDKNEDSTDLESKYINNPLVHEKFNRSQKLKSVIYDINKDEGLVDINELLEIFTMKCVGFEDSFYGMRTYFDYLFF